MPGKTIAATERYYRESNVATTQCATDLIDRTVPANSHNMGIFAGNPCRFHQFTGMTGISGKFNVIIYVIILRQSPDFLRQFFA